MPLNQDIVNLARFIVRCDPRDLSKAGSAPTDSVKDWNSFIALAEAHRIGPLSHAVLTGTGAAIPPAAEQALTQVRKRHTILNLARAAELLQVLEAFRTENIAAMPFKGVALSAQLYGDYTLRAAGDLDLFIRWDDLQKATEVILARGYRLTTPLGPNRCPTWEGGFEYHFERAADGMVFELHWQLNYVHARYSHVIGLDWVGDHWLSIQIAGGTVRTPNAEATLLLLCMHGSKHRWDRLNWVCDVAQLLRVSPELDWSRIRATARKAGLQKAVALGLMLAEGICGVSSHVKVLRELDSFPSVRGIAKKLERDFFDQPREGSKGVLPFHARLMDRPDLLRFVFSKEMLRPTSRDEEFFPLPPSLRWMHVLIRPFRLLMDRSAR